MSPFLLAPARLRRPALVLAALALTASAGAAQAVPGDACAGAVVRPAADSVAHTVALRVVALDPTQGVPVTLTRLVAEGVAQYLVRPASVAMLAARVMPGERGAPATAAATLAGEYLATLARGGRLGGARVLSTSLDPTFDGAILAAIDSIAADGYLFEPPMTMRGDSALLRLQVVRAEDATPGDRAPVAILHTRVPRHVVSDSAGAAVGDAVPAARRDGAPLATFVVDTAGAPLPSTVRVPGFDDATALRTLRDELPRLRYHPARVAGCRVPTFVTRPLAPGDSSVHDAAAALPGGAEAAELRGRGAHPVRGGHQRPRDPGHVARAARRPPAVPRGGAHVGGGRALRARDDRRAPRRAARPAAVPVHADARHRSGGPRAGRATRQDAPPAVPAAPVGRAPNGRRPPRRRA
jgi:hypothetical protein